MTRFTALAAALMLALPPFKTAVAQTIALQEENATVWSQDQVIRGTLTDATAGTVYVNGAPSAIALGAPGPFALPVRLTDMQTTVVACVSDGSGQVCPDTLRWTLGYRPRPEAEVRASVAGSSVTLTGRVLSNPLGANLTFTWAEDVRNPAPLGLQVATDSSATFSVPAGAMPGEYYVTWTVSAGADSREVSTFVTVEADGTVRPFVMEDDHAAWIDEAVIYEITPYHFPRPYAGNFNQIRMRLPELATLGVNTLWIQPVTPTTEEDYGYAVTDYFGIRSQLGNAESLRQLIDAAHALGMRVIFDFVPNHTALEHPYARNAITHGARSHYYDFYQRAFDNAPYSNNYNYLDVGQMRFVYYFWDELVNLNFDSPEVQRLIIEASRYWIENFDIDGYRFDAVWGVQARNPAFVQEWRLALKRIRPDVFLLAESKATDEALFNQRFDAAYDWTASTSYISQWAWQRNSQTSTLFNTGAETVRATYLRNALTDFGRGFAPNAIILRYLENNDTPRFARSHTVAATKSAAVLEFALPGIPMVFYGQEVGANNDLYGLPSYASNRTIASYDQQGYFPLYQQLIRVRDRFPALRSRNLAEISVSPAAVAGKTYAFRRWESEQNVVGVVNLGATAIDATLALPVGDMGLDPSTTYYLTDLITGEALSGTGAQLASYSLAVPGSSTRLFAVADSVVSIPVDAEPSAPSAPTSLQLEPNAPNPFTDRTVLNYTVGTAGRVRLRVYDVLGREVATLVDGEMATGRHSVLFDGAGLASGLYVCRLESGTAAVTRTIVLAR